MTNFLDLRGHQFGRLKAISRVGGRWLCRCNCGNEKLVLTYNLRGGHTLSCGCLQKERAAKANSRHGQSKTSAYHSWAGIKSRCNNPNSPAYKWYGERGISYDPKWETFAGFYADMGDCPAGLSIDRIDNDGPYSAENCRWANDVEQANNTRTTKFVEWNGQKRTISEWARALGATRQKLYKRLYSGWSVDDTLSTP